MALFVRLFAPRNFWHFVLTFVVWMCLFNIVYFAIMTAAGFAPSNDWTRTLMVGAATCTPFLFIALLMLRHQLLMQIQLDNLARTDALTGLQNRRAFLEDAANGARTQSDLVILLDLDHFKKVNDTYGHALGDVCLERVAHFLRRAVRPTDLVARYGGEEFAVILRDLPVEHAFEVGERVARGRLFDLGEVEIEVTFSIGIAVWDFEMSLEAALNNADAALYTAKASGRSRAIVYGHNQPPRTKVLTGVA